MRQRTDQARLTRFPCALGRLLRRPVRLYLVGGSVLIDLGLAIRELKNELDVDVEPASPADFLPIPRSVLVQSRFVARYGQLSVYYYHLPSLVVARAARGFEQDLADAERLLRSGAVAWTDVEATPRRMMLGLPQFR